MSLLSDFFGNNTETMNTSYERMNAPILRGMPVTENIDFYDDFVYPYSPMQKTKRFPKIINAYALQERARADVRGFINHKELIDNLTQRVAALEVLEHTSRIDAVKQISSPINVANNGSVAFEQTFILYNYDNVVGVSQAYFNSNNYDAANADFRLCGFSYTSEPYDDDRKLIRWRVTGTNQSGAQRNDVRAVVLFHIFRGFIT